MTDIKLKFWRYNSWPYSIDHKPSEEASLEEWWVPKEETFVEKGKRYYPMLCGHGTIIDLLVGYNKDYAE